MQRLAHLQRYREVTVTVTLVQQLSHRARTTPHSLARLKLACMHAWCRCWSILGRARSRARRSAWLLFHLRFVTGARLLLISISAGIKHGDSTVTVTRCSVCDEQLCGGYTATSTSFWTRSPHIPEHVNNFWKLFSARTRRVTCPSWWPGWSDAD